MYKYVDPVNLYKYELVQKLYEAQEEIKRLDELAKTPLIGPMRVEKMHKSERVRNLYIECSTDHGEIFRIKATNLRLENFVTGAVGETDMSFYAQHVEIKVDRSDIASRRFI